LIGKVNPSFEFEKDKRRKKGQDELIGGKRKKSPSFPRGTFTRPGDELLSRWKHYHGPQVLIGRVRDGNGSFHLGMVTGIHMNIDNNSGRYEVARETRARERKVWSSVRLLVLVS
jgi:hypothetical protein